MGASFPDPLVTANIYCEDHLDQLICQAIAPFWQELSRQDNEHDGYLWFLRYARCGEHLKIRLHGPPHRRMVMERLLKESVEPFLASLGNPEEGAPRRSGKEAPPIDTEDRATTDYPDRTLLWTEYGRSHVSLGGKPFLLDDTYAALFTRCLSRGCEIVLAALRPDEQGRIPHRLRQSTLLKLLLSGLAALDFPLLKREEYLAFHRDWLVRFTLLKNRTSREKAGEVLALFDLRAEKMGSSLESLREVVSREWGDSGKQGETNHEETAWKHALVDLLRYVTPFCADPDYHLDPFASDPVFSPMFKVFHGVANQLGLPMLDEAFAHHLLLQSLVPKDTHEPRGERALQTTENRLS